MGEFNSNDHYIYYCEQESLRRNGVAIIVNKRVQNVILGCSLKNDRMISVHFQGEPFNITTIQVYAPMSNAEETEVEQVYEDLQDLLELTPKKDVLFIIEDWNAKVESQETAGVTGKFGLGNEQMIKTESVISRRRCYLTGEGYRHLQRAARVRGGPRQLRGSGRARVGPISAFYPQLNGMHYSLAQKGTFSPLW